uniref:Uncharacterized protein n=1 Tax=Ditylenchus dipsaci TaxID=166011 RepID=A0A915CYZ2_9BILA
MSGTLTGLAICLLSSCGFGSMFVVLRGRDLQDGIFVQFIMSCTIFFVGFCCNLVSGFPAFQPLAMLGGVLWTIGQFLKKFRVAIYRIT